MTRDPARRSPLPALPVRGVVRIRVENELLDPSLGNWDRAFLRRVRKIGPLRGRSRDRLDSIGQAYFDVYLRPRLLYAGVSRVRAARKAGHTVVLESAGYEPVIRPLARHLAADRFIARFPEFRDDVATGRIPSERREADAWPRRPGPAAPVLVDGPLPLRPLNVREALGGKRLLVIGGTGFIGKVWIAELLGQVPDVKLELLLRRRGSRSAQRRWTQLLQDSPVFDELRQRHGPDPAPALAGRVRVLEGDIRERHLGLGADDAARLDGVDIVVNCAGLTDFNPDPRAAYGINVESLAHLLDLAQAHRFGVLHVSTCFVAGAAEGRIPERLDWSTTPNGTGGFVPREECDWLRRTLQEAPRPDGRPARGALVDAVRDRAHALGWPNIYTYTKALGEGLIADRCAQDPSLRCTVVRPSIVESATAFPMRGWNEGVNTSAPLSYLLGTGFRQLPVNRRKRLDVIPVDRVSRGLTLAAAALAEGRRIPVMQLATSASNPLDLRRAVELTSLAHREHYLSRPGWRSRVLARLEAIPVSRERYGRLSVPAQLRALRALNRLLAPMRGGRAPFARSERQLQRVKELIDLYEPFLLDNEPVFEADQVERLNASLPAEDRAEFGYDVRSLDWHDYWIRVHIPGLRRWSFPLIEGRPIESAEPADAGPSAAGAVPRPGARTAPVPERRSTGS